MRNRSIPFGYQYQNGVLAAHPQESQTVQAVFTAYLSGEPLSKIAAHLTTKLVEYLPGRWQWDKARVKRILDNAKYIGNGEYPPIIKEKDFQLAHQKKESANTNRQPVDEDIKLFKGLTYCHHCGCLMVRRMDSRMEHPVTWRCAQCSYFLSLPDEEFKRRVFLLQQRLVDKPLLAEKEEEAIPVTSMEARRLTNEISASWTAVIVQKMSWGKFPAPMYLSLSRIRFTLALSQYQQPGRYSSSLAVRRAAILLRGSPLRYAANTFCTV